MNQTVHRVRKTETWSKTGTQKGRERLLISPNLLSVEIDRVQKTFAGHSVKSGITFQGDVGHQTEVRGIKAIRRG